MASHPLGPSAAVPPSEWNSSVHSCNHNQMMAGIRASLIALALLGVLVLIILY